MTAFDPDHADVARDIDRDTDIAEAVEAARADVEPIECEWCGGSGQIMGPRVGGRVVAGITCRSCKGRGRIEEAE